MSEISISGKKHERVVSRTLLVGTIVGGFGTFAGVVSALWQAHPHVLRSALFTGSTLVAFSSGSTFLTELYREGSRTRQGRASLLDSFTAGTLWGVVISRGSLGIRGPRLGVTALYLGAASAVIDYCMLTALTPGRLIKSNEDKVNQEVEQGKSSRSYWSWLPIVGERARRIDELYGEIEELENKKRE